MSVQTLNNVDCDGFPFGNSDFVWEFTGTDNTLGLTNNNPALFGFFDFNYAYLDGDNGPYTISTPNPQVSPSNGVFFDHEYLCATDVPSQINLAWEAYENDDASNYDLDFFFPPQGETGIQNVILPTPVGAGVLSYVFTANSTDGGCSQSYRITLEVERIPLVVTYLEDNICDAAPFTLNTTYTMGWCDYTLEPNEPAAIDVQNSGSGWFQFVAPPSGAVEVTSDLSGTELGTYFEIYHAADGSVCNTGIQPITAVIIKDKFEYLSHVEFSDGLDFLFDPEAEIIFDDCNPLPGFSYQKLIPGETYYVQFTADNPSDIGYFEIRVNSFSGSSPNLEDIPCLSSTVIPDTFAISSTASSPITTNLSFGCAFDGGNDFGETGSQHTSANPNEYHAYDYDHTSVNNADMNESVWLNFIAPNNGRMVFETDYQSTIYSESSALFGYDARFSPGIPADYSCANLDDLYAQDGALNGFLGGSVQSAIIDARCLEPGYKYYGMVDPASSLTAFSTQDINTWLYDPSVVDPTTNPPGNDILCLTTSNTLYEIPVTPAGTNPLFQAVAGTNEFACREYLAGEPASDLNSANRADQTVWHYFVAPPSGAVEMNIRAYIGMNQLRYSIYELLNGTDCYGGLLPATYTQDGTRNTSIVSPLLQGVAGFSGTQESLCCLVPGKIYAIQLDGGSPGDEGQYIIEYIREVASDAGDIFIALNNGDTVTVNIPDTAFVCFGETFSPGIMLNGIGETTLDIPSCLQLGYVIHSINPVPHPVSNTGFTFIDSVQTENGVFVNDTDGSGTFSNPSFNQLYYVSPMADEPSTWGDLSCITSTVGNGVPVVFLQPIVPISNYNSSNCEITFTATGGMSDYDGSSFSYSIENSALNTVAVGTFVAGTSVNFPVPSAEIYTISVSDGACPYSFTIDASACSNPCISSPNINFVSTTICNGQSIFLQGANQTAAGLYTDVFEAVNGCDSTIYTTLSIIDPVAYSQTFTICQGTTISVGTSTYSTSGIYTDVLVALNGCDSIITTTLFVESSLSSNLSATICQGNSYSFGGNALVSSGTYTNNLVAIGGCDSIVSLFLTVLPIETSSLNSSICQGQSYLFDGQSYNISGSYSQILTTINGCDSIVTLNLTVNPILTGVLNATICQGQSYTFGSQVLSSSGIYTETFTTASGCDSIATLSLNVNGTLSGSTSMTICSGQSYVFGSQTLTASGTYVESFNTTSGCDSITTLYLFVTDAKEYFQDTAICSGESYLFGSQSITVSGVYNELFTNALGCDSLVHLELSVTDCSIPFEISNIVTPNDDGQNDTWKISDYTKITGCDVTIYNRWGQPVYASSAYQNEWGGTKDGQPLPDGVYYYSIKCSDTDYTGTVNLFRFKK
jgi:gliding motility-associated-like protein